MAFWRKSKTKQNLTQSKVVDVVTTVEENPKEAIPVSLEEARPAEERLSALGDKAKELFGDLPVKTKPSLLPAGQLVGAKPVKKIVNPPRDTFSVAVYKALVASQANPASFSSCIRLLEDLVKLENRLKVLNYRIEKLANESTAREAEFEEHRFEEYLQSATHADEEDEASRETLDHNEELAKKREEYKRSIITLAQLESSRASIKKDISQSLTMVTDVIPPEAYSIIHPLVQSKIDELDSFTNVATSDGEKSLSSED